MKVKYQKFEIGLKNSKLFQKLKETIARVFADCISVLVKFSMQFPSKEAEEEIALHSARKSRKEKRKNGALRLTRLYSRKRCL